MVEGDLVDSVVTVTFVDSFLDRLLEMEERVTLIGPPSVRSALRDRLSATLIRTMPSSRTYGWHEEESA